MKGNCHRNLPTVVVFGMGAMSTRPEVDSEDRECSQRRLANESLLVGSEDCATCFYFVKKK